MIAAGTNRNGLNRYLSGVALVAVLVASACTTQTMRQPAMGASTSVSGGEFAGVAPVLSVERFLQAVNAQDYQAMARLFGTVNGPVQGESQEIELRMATIAQILQHQDYRIESERLEPGRAVVTRRVGVDMTIGNQVVPDVAFMVVQMENGRWMVQEIDLEKVTGA